MVLRSIKGMKGVITIDIYLDNYRNEMFDDDEIDDFELGFMEGYCTFE